ncbi:MAG TPA: hypothetical protein ENJ95_13665, partial [Bacteroidetes bacterium]|nr:hypothetical protein [Bacteroidota bacterium]
MKTCTKKFLLLFFLFVYTSVDGQPGFNMLHDLDLPTNHLRKMLVHNDTVIGYGLAYPSDTVGSRQGLLLTKFDSNGVLLKSNLLLEPFGDFYSIGKNWGDITTTFDGGYAMTASALVGNSAYLIKIDHDLEVEFIKEYPDTVNLSNFSYKVLETKDGYLLYGDIQMPDFNLRS